ncbi:choice-of-anchor A family protein [Pseudoalteromonas sp. APC 3213]|mgnify:CR=1 FL=1|uniref:choice-of-anchor A family protein n=1 Tax=Pseudoalteromonas sp. APC 3213 TaxID=3035178 RepID=UPI0025B35D27|nr:choice-of-anchor A family protein [Pseudoalteromonas sp. APC 3213]MDN3401554.1 choice-of-anchor A family protein [Pseudoalteromonas sp. APC 3213]|tara:strand:- start:313 stop:2529 length:2217 start_codon:yes stop_codon:yes gene_type:complete
MTNSLLKFKKISAVIALTLASSTTLAADLGVANNFSAFVFEDFKSNFGRADGAIAAGEIDLKGYSVGYTRPYSPEEYYLISESTIDFKYGRQYVGSMIAGGGTDIHWGVRWGMEWGSKILSNQDESALPFNFDEQEQYYKDLSTQLSELDETGTVYRKWGGLYLQGDGSSDRQVFNLDARDFAKAHTFKVWGIPADATIIFNITGDDNVVVKGKSFARLRHHASKTVFNFTNAQKLDIKGNRWQGVILAPYADIRGVYGTAKMPIIGQSFYGSMALLGGEFNGDLPSVAQPISPFAMEQKWHWNSSDFMPEYNQVMTTPVVGQLNDDNHDGLINENDVADVIVVTFSSTNTSNGILRALSGVDGTELWDYQNGQIYSDARYSPALADLDNDGFVEIVLSDRNSDTISVIDHLGNVKKSINKFSPKSGRSIGSVSISDMNNDGVADIAVGDAVFTYENEVLFSYGWAPAPIMFDSNDDGIQELFANSTLFDTNGAVLWTYPSLEKSWFSSVANLDSDYQPELIVSIPATASTGEKSSLAALEHNGNVKWQIDTTTAPGGGVQSISNFLENGELGIVYANYNSVKMIDTTGNEKWSVEIDDSFSGKIGVSAYDFNGDGIDEVIVQDHFKVKVLNGVNGELLSSIDNSTATLWEYPIVVDLEGDDNAELITVSNNYDSKYNINNGVTVYGAADNSKPWKNATRIWNQHSYHQTNINQDGTLPTYELPSWLNNNTYRSSTLK